MASMLFQTPRALPRLAVDQRLPHYDCSPTQSTHATHTRPGVQQQQQQHNKPSSTQLSPGAQPQHQQYSRPSPTHSRPGARQQQSPPQFAYNELDYPQEYRQKMAHYPPLSATFIPTGHDDYYMPPPTPELVAPAPQRHMPEMSDQIQSGIANLNMNGQAPPSNSSTGYAGAPSAYDWAFPKILNRMPNIPSTDEELEARLESARMPVLTSNDASMQLTWAQDALLYAQVNAENEERLQATQPPRPGTPPIERQIKMDAMNVVGFLADQHHPQAEFMRGMWFEFGRFGVAQDKKEAFRCYSRAADKGYARAEYRIAMLYETANDHIKALKHYNRGADQGDSPCLYRLGMMMVRGQFGQVQDYRRGLELIRRSADGADENAPQGGYIYGMLLARQLPQLHIPDALLPVDIPQARAYIEKAAFQRFSRAQAEMGLAYERGQDGALDCPFDPVLSLHYNRLAAKQDEPSANLAISKWFLVGSEDGLFEKNEEIAYVHANRAAQKGLADAEFAMGYYNELGIFVPVNLDLAVEWYNRAHSNGNQDAADRIEGIARKQVLTRKDHEKVAIKRITSQYGSQHGARPTRFTKGHPPRGSSLSGQIIIEQPGQPQPQPPLRTGSTPYPEADMAPPVRAATTPYPEADMPPPLRAATTPYPEDDRPPTVPPGGGRSASVAPYPLSDRPSANDPQLHGGFLKIDPHGRPSTAQPERPSNAFSFDPTLRSSSTTSTASGHQALPPHMRPQPRPGSVPNQNRPQQGRMASGPAALANQGRLPSNPGGMPTMPGQGRMPSNPAGMPPRVPSTAPTPTPPPHIRNTPPPADFGFSAPPDERESRRRPQPGQQGRETSNSNKPLPAAAPSPLSPSSSNPTMNRPPPRTSSMSNLSNGGQAPSAAAPAPAPVAAPPPKKGPQTFDEMGVPQIKKKDGCVVM